MPFKFHRNGRQKFRVANWRDYEAALRNRGSLTIWFTAEAIAYWRAQPRATPGGQRHYSDLAIETALTLRAVFGLALRQTEGLSGSIMQLLEIDLPVPDHTTLSRRAGGLKGPSRRFATERGCKPGRPCWGTSGGEWTPVHSSSCGVLFRLCETLCIETDHFALP